MRRLTAKQAIKQYCIGCIYDPKAPGTNIAQVEACQITKCELYAHRPLTSKTKARMREEKLNGVQK